MAQFDVYGVPGSFLLDVQTDLLTGFPTRIVVPLLPLEDAPVAHRRLNPTLAVDGIPYFMATQYMAAVPLLQLGRPVANLSGSYDQIRAACDMIFIGF